MTKRASDEFLKSHGYMTIADEQKEFGESLTKNNPYICDKCHDAVSSIKFNTEHLCFKCSEVNDEK